MYSPISRQLKPNAIKSFFALLKKDFLAYSPLSYKGSVKKYILKIFFTFLLLFGLFFIWKYIINIYNFNYNVLNAVVPGYIFLYLVVSVLQVAFSSQSIVFLAKDESLQVLPISPLVIYASRIVSKLFNEFLKTALFMFPFFIALYHSSINTNMFGNEVLYYLRVFIIVLAIPLFSVFLGTILQPSLVYLREIIKKSNIIFLVITIAAASLLVILFIYFVSGFLDDYGFIRTDVMRKRWYSYDRSLSDIFNSSFIVKYLYPIIYKDKSISTIGVNFTRTYLLIHLLYILLFLVGLAYLAVLVIYLSYYDLINISKSSSSKEKKPSTLFLKTKSLFKLFFLKEFVLFWRRKEIFRNQILYYLTGPIVIFMINMVLSKLDLNFYGVRIAVVMNIVINLLLVCLANFVASITFTADQRFNETIKKILPNSSPAVYAKLLFSVINLLVITVISFVIMAVFNPFQKYLKSALYLIFIINIIYGLIHLLLSFLKDMQSHNYEQIQTIMESKSITNTIVWGIGITVFVLAGHFTFGLAKIYYAQGLLIGLGLLALLILSTHIAIYMKVILNRPEDYIHE